VIYGACESTDPVQRYVKPAVDARSFVAITSLKAVLPDPSFNGISSAETCISLSDALRLNEGVVCTRRTMGILRELLRRCLLVEDSLAGRSDNIGPGVVLMCEGEGVIKWTAVREC
jgi:hypothetical protein